MGGPISDRLYVYDYSDEGLDHSVRGVEIIPKIRELKSLLDIYSDISDSRNKQSKFL